MRETLDARFITQALRLARRGRGLTSPNPMVGALLVKNGKVIGSGWHHRSGMPHAEIEAIKEARRNGHRVQGSTLYVTLEPCSTHGRTPPCTDAIRESGIKRVVIGATDPNPKHSGRACKILASAGIAVDLLADAPSPAHRPSKLQLLGKECESLNESFNHWIVHRTPFVTVKAAMTLDGKIATADGRSKWITGEEARAQGMKLRQANDAILVGIETVLMDDPSLTVRTGIRKPIRRFILDTRARIPAGAKVLNDEYAALTTVVVGKSAPKNRVAELAKRVNLWNAPETRAGGRRQVNLRWLLRKMGGENVTSLLVEGGGEVNASFLLARLANRAVFFYAQKILGGRDSRKAVAGEGAKSLRDVLQLRDLLWRKIGADLMITARVD